MMQTMTWGNPYTHEEHSRTTYTSKDLLHGYGVCDWCGQVRFRLYQYDGRKGIFCAKDCYRSYHE